MGIAAAMMLFPGVASAQPIDGQILEDVTVEVRADAVEFTARFSLIVLYLDHFPHKAAEEIRVRLLRVPIGSGEPELLFGREGMVVRRAGSVPEVSVIYEGDDAGGPTLIFRFDRPTAVDVRQGADFRSISITVPKS